MTVLPKFANIGSGCQPSALQRRVIDDLERTAARLTPELVLSIPVTVAPGYCRVGDWRGCGRRTGAAVPGSFRNAGASVRPLTPFPASATSYAACGFPALRTPARLMPRVMGPIKPGALSAAAVWDDVNGTERCPVFGKIRCPIFCTLRNSNLGCYPAAALPSSSFTATLSIPALRLVLSR